MHLPVAVDLDRNARDFLFAGAISTAMKSPGPCRKRPGPELVHIRESAITEPSQRPYSCRTICASQTKNLGQETALNPAGGKSHFGKEAGRLERRE
jgi:hypothetical protein